MRLPALLSAAVLVPLLALMPRAAGQALPDLGGTADSPISPQMERRVGESIVRDIRARDPTYLDDPEIEDYLGAIGTRLAQANPAARMDFDFFVIRDPTVNAFALPGGFVGVHTGLITMAETESELASVLGHEIAHVTQRHIARMLGFQKQAQLPMLVAMAAAVLLGGSRPDLASGMAAAAQAGAVQSQLGYSRDFEREADRIGFQTLSAAGFDVRAMPTFFEKMQRYTRIMDDGRVPGYLRSHPVTTERIADSQGRAAGEPYRQHRDSLEYHLVRAKLRADGGDAKDGAAHFEAQLRDGRYASEPAVRYGLALALLRAGNAAGADAQVSRLRAAGVASPMLETLAARVRLAARDAPGALAVLKAARERYPNRRPVLYAYVQVLQDLGRHAEAQAALAEPLRLYPRDAKLHEARARSYAAQGKRLLQHQSQAELYALQGILPAAIEQLQLAQAAGDGDFYELSVVEARLKALRAQHAEELKESRRAGAP
jgi:predicted Zn-dependent protease